MLPKFIKLVKQYETETVLALTTILISVLSFQIGKVYTFSHWPTANFSPQAVSAEDVFLTDALPAAAPLSAQTEKTNKTKTFEMTVVASKNSDKYHFLWCPGASKISSKNKVTFASETAAITAGYILASNCQK